MRLAFVLYIFHSVYYICFSMLYTVIPMQYILKCSDLSHALICYIDAAIE